MYNFGQIRISGYGDMIYYSTPINIISHTFCYGVGTATVIMAFDFAHVRAMTPPVYKSMEMEPTVPFVMQTSTREHLGGAGKAISTSVPSMISD